ncbi:MAG TPA: hypothetical protein VJS92_10745, partial [Candidatus Polarisedimenticolaceae bacterium]|nr:hypothetical protein [Candidatus Polarisedimenticolaceae bacterium]
CPLHAATAPRPARASLPRPRWVQPTAGLHLALDPRIPDELEAFTLEIGADSVAEVEWRIDGERLGVSGPGVRRWTWPLVRGRHVAQARVRIEGSPAVEMVEVAFLVR